MSKSPIAILLKWLKNTSIVDYFLVSILFILLLKETRNKTYIYRLMKQFPINVFIT
jgi:hypothetical protein